MKSYHRFVISVLEFVCVKSGKLVHVLAAPPGAAGARDLDVLNGELVVVGQLLSDHDLAQGEDQDVFLAQDVDDLGVAVGLKEKNCNNRSC